MIFTAILFIIGIAAVNFLTILLVKRWLFRVFHAYFDVRGDKPSEFTAHVEQVSGMVASAIVRSLKAQFLNASSINTRQGAALEGQAAVEGLKSFNLGELAMSMPGLEKMVKKNPILGFFANMALSKMAGPATPQTVTTSGNGSGSGNNMAIGGI